ncbi:MAG: transglutaminase-like domain-containing protein, partial [Planctomycetota bacterium]
MRRCLLLLLALVGCSREEEASAPGPLVAEAKGNDITAAPPAPAPPVPEAASSAPADTLTSSPDRLALRCYERLMNNRRAATMRVEWTAVERDGRRLVEDVTESRTVTDRDMAGMKERFTSKTTSTTLRTEEGELVSMENVEDLGVRKDTTRIERTPAGYKVTVSAGPNTETFEIATEKPVMVDAEAFLGAKIRTGQATPGATFPLPLLDTGRRRVAEATLRVVGPDAEGPGLKIVQSYEGQDSLWWFAEDGSVVRLREGITIIRRDDKVKLDDLPKRAATYRITLPANVDLPRLFTTRQMLVDIVVKADETTKAPRLPQSPFTEILSRTDDRVTAMLKSHDDPAATCPLPIDAKGLEDYLKPTPLMEVDDPGVRTLAQKVAGDATDAREAARRIADYVFRSLRKGSPAIPEPTAKEILRLGTGDCSEHSLLFTA